MATQDIRWKQRFHNFSKAFSQLQEAVEAAGKRELSKLEKQGVIQAFEYTHELAWKTLKDFLGERGNINIYGSKDATREAFQAELIGNGEVWMDMIASRNRSTHTYNEETAEAIFELIVEKYYREFELFRDTFSKFAEREG